MSADNRTVATDALATLGTLITEKEKRDAIHLAVIPVVAGQTLSVGADVGMSKDGCAYHWHSGEKITHVGIVDPFLKEEYVGIGERFWLVIYPRKITSLRHVWEHPAFPDEEPAPQSKMPATSISAARMRLEAVSRNAGYVELEDFLENIEENLKYGCQSLDATSGRKPDSNQLDEAFWVDWSIVTGKPLPQKDNRPSYFSCSC